MGCSDSTGMKTIDNPTANGSGKNDNSPMDKLENRVKSRGGHITRRSFLGNTIALTAGTVGAGLLSSIRTAEASGGLTAGDAALLSFPTGLELIEDGLLI